MNDDMKKVILRASLFANVIMIIFFFIYSGIIEREHANRIYSLSKTILIREMDGDSLLKDITEKNEKIYEFENLSISKDVAIEDLKKRLKEQAREYKSISSNVTVSMEAKSDTIEAPLQLSGGAVDSITVSLPRAFKYEDKWISMNGFINKNNGDLLLVIPEISMPSGKIHIDNLTPKRKIFQLKKPEDVIRIQVESPYYSLLSAQQFSVPPSKEKTLGQKIFLSVFLFTIGGLTFMAVVK